MTQALKRRFTELLNQLGDVDRTRELVRDSRSGSDQIDADLFLSWRVKARNLLLQACGAESEHYKEFQNLEKNPGLGAMRSYSFMSHLRAVFLAAKEDFEGGYLRSIRSLIHAELFDEELEQARELQTSGYKSAAAVVAGVVLETTLRKLCGDMSIPVGKLDKMNADLAKAGLYDTLIQKRVTMLADIRNKAAHGNTASFNDADVSDMIAQVERFVSDYPTA
jgi:hypothetical protein